VLVFYNASTDGTADNVEREFPRARVIRSPQNVGHTRGFNRSIVHARGEYVLLLDSDTELARDAIERTVDFLGSRNDVGLVAPRTLNTDGSVQESARRFPRPINGLFGRQSLLTRLFPGNPLSRRYLQTDRISAEEPFEVEQISGACMLFRRELVNQAGLWDEGYFAYWVDSDWCFRIQQRGWKVYCVPSAIIVHHEQNHRGRKKSPRRIWMFHYGAYRFYTKNMTWGVLDPRAVGAGIALGAHGVFQLIQNLMLPPQKPSRVAKTE
jgi:N-acetylglucosaminyl-diphospho-decaprenol L-rhamnosyltransferase